MQPGCEKVLESLWPLGELGGPDSPELAAEARKHLEYCHPCQQFLRRDATLRRRLRDIRLAGGADRYPEDAKIALLALLSGEDTVGRPIKSARSRRFPAWTGAAVGTAAAIILLAGGLLVSPSAQAPVSDGAFARDYALAALPELVSTELTVSQVSAFYDRQFGGRMQPAALLDAPVRRVAVCDVEGRRGAMVEYDIEGMRLVYYQLLLEDTDGTVKLRLASEDGLNMARWGDGDTEHVIVSEMPMERLEAIARARMN